MVTSLPAPKKKKPAAKTVVKKNAVVKPKAVVSFFGISDMADMYNNPAGGNALISFSDGSSAQIWYV